MRTPPDIQSYWDRKIIEWEDSIHSKPGTPWIESIAARFRRPVMNRADVALELLARQVANKNVLELGCGSGFFAVRLFRTARPARITGIDFSPAAIQRAGQYAEHEHLGNAVSFRVGDVTRTILPEADFTIGLGLLDYLDHEEIRSLFERIRSPKILFTFSRSDLSPLRLAHIVYLATQKCPKHYYHSEEALSSLIGSRFGHLTFVADRCHMSFGGIVHNLESPSA